MARFLVFLVFLMMVSPSLAGDEWLFADTKREVLYLTLHTIDWAQTRTIARHPEMYRETNVFLGEHPSTGRVDRYFALTALGHVGISYVLPQQWRKWFQISTITMEVVVVADNKRIGIAVDF